MERNERQPRKRRRRTEEEEKKKKKKRRRRRRRRKDVAEWIIVGPLLCRSLLLTIGRPSITRRTSVCRTVHGRCSSCRPSPYLRDNVLTRSILFVSSCRRHVTGRASDGRPASPFLSLCLFFSFFFFSSLRFFLKRDAFEEASRGCPRWTRWQTDSVEETSWLCFDSSLSSRCRRFFFFFFFFFFFVDHLHPIPATCVSSTL